MDRLLDVKDLSEILGLSPFTVYKLARDKKIPFIRLSPKAIRFREKDINEWIEKMQIKTETNDAGQQRHKRKMHSSVSEGYIERIVTAVKKEVLN